MKSFRVIGICDTNRPNLDTWKPPQTLVTGATEKYAIKLIERWIKNHPKEYDEYVIAEETTSPGYKRSIVRIKYRIKVYEPGQRIGKIKIADRLSYWIICWNMGLYAGMKWKIKARG